jgi:LysM repeat protein
MNSIEYRIKSGDTLFSIARRHGVTVDELSRLNGISDVNRIWADQVLRIPIKTQALPLPVTQSRTYRVRAGDTLSEIARREHLTVAALVQANDIHDPDHLVVGQVLSIPRLPSSQPTKTQAPLLASKTPKSVASNTPSRVTGTSSAPLKQNGTKTPSLDVVRSGDAVLGSPMRGPAVEEVQRLLVRANYLSQKQMDTGPGRYGPATRLAVTAFQRHTHFWPVGHSRGVVDKQTLEKLLQTLATSKPGQQKSTGPAILARPSPWQGPPNPWTTAFPWSPQQGNAVSTFSKTPVAPAKAMPAGSVALQASPPTESWVGSILDWLWGTLQGDFNPNPSKSQIVVNMVLGLIPLVDQVLDIRDLIAGMKDIIEYYMEDASEQKSHPSMLGLSHESWLWINAFIIAIGAIPIIGSAVKGTLKTVISFLRDFGKKAGSLSAEHIKTLLKFLGPTKEIALTKLNDIARGVKDWLSPALAWIKQGLNRFRDFLASCKEFARNSVIAQSATWLSMEKELARFLAAIDQIKKAIQKSCDQLEKMKTQVNQWLGEQFGVLIQPKKLPTKGVASGIPPNGGRTTLVPVGAEKAEGKIAEKTITSKMIGDEELEKLLGEIPNWTVIEPFVGRRIPAQGSAEFEMFKKEVKKAGYSLSPMKQGSQRFRLSRLNGKETQAALTVTHGDMVVLKVGGNVRLSVPSRCRKNYLEWVEKTQSKAAREAVQKSIQEGYQLHHLIPDKIAQADPLILEALKRLEGYTIDRGVNILDMPSAWNEGGELAHLGQHPQYSKLVAAELNQATNELLQNGTRTLEEVSPKELDAAISKVEADLRNMFKNKDKRLPVKEIEKDGKKFFKLAILGGPREGEVFTV